eukprot:scaffold19185_cov59-Phaeocystis_antarctica.AAC.3
MSRKPYFLRFLSQKGSKRRLAEGHAPRGAVCASLGGLGRSQALRISLRRDLHVSVRSAPRRYLESLGSSQTAQGGAHGASRRVAEFAPIMHKSPKRPCAPRHNEQPLGRFGTILDALGLSVTRYTR